MHSHENGTLSAELEELRETKVELNSTITELRRDLKASNDARQQADEELQDLREEHQEEQQAH